MTVFKPIAELQTLPIWGGVVARVVEGRDMTFAIVELEPNATVAQHHHPNEQIGVVLSGSIRFTIGSEVRNLSVGDTYNIASDVPHEAVAGPKGCVVVDVFAPIRADWRRFTPVAPTPPSWP